jgi:hypothetical protein
MELADIILALVGVVTTISAWVIKSVITDVKAYTLYEVGI